MILSIDTSGSNCVVVLSDAINSQNFQFKQQVDAKKHSLFLLPFIHDLLDSNGCECHDLSAIVLGAGPGSFVGVRMAAAVVQGLSFGLNVPVFRISSLHVLAQSAYLMGEGAKICILRNAHMGDSYIGYYHHNSDVMRPTRSDYSCKSSDFEEPQDGYCLATTQQVVPKALHELACFTVTHDEPIVSEKVLPLYLRGDSLWQR